MATTHEVKIVHDENVEEGQASFQPDPITVRAGDSIVWINQAHMRHTATNFDNPSLFDTGTLTPGATSAPQLFSAEHVGIAYGCRFHADMAGTVIVSAEPVVVPDPVPVPMTHEVKIVHDENVEEGQASFQPDPITITAGESIVWINQAHMRHTATNFDDPSLFDTGTLNPGDTSAPQLFGAANPGIAYGCMFHADMAGTVIVNPAPV